MTLATRAALWSLAAAAALVAVLAVGRSTGNQAAERERAEIAERNAAVVTKAYKAARDSIPYLRTEARNARMEALHARGTAEETMRVAAAVTDSARRILSAGTADVPTLRVALAAQVAATDSIAQAFARYRESIDKAFAASDRLTLKQAEALAKADSALAAKDRAIVEWKAAATCRFLWMECPTRTQVAAGTLIAVIVVPKIMKAAK